MTTFGRRMGLFALLLAAALGQIPAQAAAPGRQTRTGEARSKNPSPLLSWAIHDDLAAIHALQQEAFRGFHVGDRDELRRLLDDTLIVRQDGEVAAYLIFTKALAKNLPGMVHPESPAFYIGALAVGKPWRRQGLAKMLLTAAMEDAKRRGGRAIYLHVWDQNHEARSLYRQLGFADVSHLPELYRMPVRGAYLMVRSLADGS